MTVYYRLNHNKFKCMISDKKLCSNEWKGLMLGICLQMGGTTEMNLIIF